MTGDIVRIIDPLGKRPPCVGCEGKIESDWEPLPYATGSIGMVVIVRIIADPDGVIAPSAVNRYVAVSFDCLEFVSPAKEKEDA